MRVDVERLRMELVLSQPVPPPRCGSSPRLSPAVGTRLDEPELPLAKMQSTKHEDFFFLQASLGDCTSLDQEGITILLQTDVGVDDAETITTKA